MTYVCGWDRLKPLVESHIATLQVEDIERECATLLALLLIYLCVCVSVRLCVCASVSVRLCVCVSVHLRMFQFMHISSPFSFNLLPFRNVCLYLGVILVQDSKSIQETELLTFKSNLIDNEYSECTRNIEIGCIKSNIQTKKVCLEIMYSFISCTQCPFQWQLGIFLFKRATVVKGCPNDRHLCIEYSIFLQEFNFSIANRSESVISHFDYLQSSFSQFEVVLDYHITFMLLTQIFNDFCHGHCFL